MSFTLNDPDPEKVWVPNEENKLDFCIVEVPGHVPRRLSIKYKHDVVTIQNAAMAFELQAPAQLIGERVCVRCRKIMAFVEEAFEAREKRRQAIV